MQLLEKKAQIPYSQEVKKLTKQYKCLNKMQIRVVLEFCQFDFKIAQKILVVLSQLTKPGLIIKQLMEKPQMSDEILQKYLNIYSVKYPQKKQDLKNQIEVKTIKHEIPDFPFFDFLPIDLIIQISLYLSPIEMIKFVNLKKQFRDYYILSQNKINEHYKKICKTLFNRQIPPLPNVCRFEQMKQYILSHPIQFSPNIRNAANNNIREFIWQMKPTDFKISKQYYLKMGNFQKIYREAPRVHFNGYYVLRQKYTKMGQKTFHSTITPYHVVHYYRYIRFFNDGSILYQISNRKMKNDQLMVHLSKKNLQGASQTMKGQYMQYKNKIFIKMYRSNSVFYYQLEINSKDGLFGGLIVKKFNLELIDSSFIVQQIFKQMPHKEQKIFFYQHFPQFLQQNSRQIQCHSL